VAPGGWSRGNLRHPVRFGDSDGHRDRHAYGDALGDGDAGTVHYACRSAQPMCARHGNPGCHAHRDCHSDLVSHSAAEPSFLQRTGLVRAIVFSRADHRVLAV
jgi:hypothetical protein